MHVLEGPEQLVHDVLLVDLLQDVGTNDCMQVCLHVLKHQVDVLVILSTQDIEQPATVQQAVSMCRQLAMLDCLECNTCTGGVSTWLLGMWAAALLASCFFAMSASPVR